MKKGKKLELNQIITEMKAGLMPSDISKKYNIPKSTLDYSLDKLKKLGCIEKIGYGTWKVNKDLEEVRKLTNHAKKVNSNFSKKEIRGHAFIWNIEFIKERYDWKQIIKNYKARYKKPKLSFKMVCSGKVPRTILKNRKIWLTRAGLTIYEPLDFFGVSAFKVKGKAVYEMDKLIKELLKELGQRFQNYEFICSREHFAHVKNQMARQFNENKQKIHVEFNGTHFWIDYSDGEHEEETNKPRTSVQAQKKYKSELRTNFEEIPERTISERNKTNNNIDKLAGSMAERDKAIQKNAEHLDYHAKNMISHVTAIKNLGKGVEKWNRRIDRLFELVSKKNVKTRTDENQTSLNNFK